MSTWITNMTHFPKPQELSQRMPMSLIQTTIHFGSIVKMAAGQGPQARHSCGGQIAAKLEADSGKVVWQCPDCGDNGEISHWRGSGWDDVPAEKMPEVVVVERKKRKPKAVATASLIIRKRALTALKKLIDESEFNSLFEEARDLGEGDVELMITLDQLSELLLTVGDLLDFGPSRERKMWDETFSEIEWVMDEILIAED
jgi:predicted RNA-binding Zn-ribbon protein involved in translation (DUF1610 family)